MKNDGIRIEPLGRPITIRFHDAVIAASNDAKVLREKDRRPLVFVPFKDCYPTFLERSGERHRSPTKGTVVAWRARAQNRSADKAVWLLEEPAAATETLANHAAFDPRVLDVDTE